MTEAPSLATGEILHLFSAVFSSRYMYIFIICRKDPVVADGTKLFFRLFSYNYVLDNIYTYIAKLKT